MALVKSTTNYPLLSENNMKRLSKLLIPAFFLSLIFSGNAQAWYGVYGGGGYRDHHHHGYERGYGWGGFYGGGWGPGPNVIINIPAEPRYYVPCETVRICDQATEQCWLERHCG
ncbi:hypothetical protein B1207_11445 [Legionella quinlivanii]|uniref:Glycine-rich protein n=2 Tax=Legionellaceae TaxID=444 RepID=A0A364LHG4_9GAMM|nr:hypothetical protein B1207_11445 [Legionella quinlivanii]